MSENDGDDEKVKDDLSDEIVSQLEKTSLYETDFPPLPSRQNDTHSSQSQKKEKQSHTEEELSPYYKVKPCRYFVRLGFCRNGDACSYYHSIPERRIVVCRYDMECINKETPWCGFIHSSESIPEYERRTRHYAPRVMQQLQQQQQQQQQQHQQHQDQQAGWRTVGNHAVIEDGHLGIRVYVH
jgi:hypothetical protein